MTDNHKPAVQHITVDPVGLVDAMVTEKLRRILEPKGLWGQTRVFENGIISCGAIQIDYNRRIAFISTAKARDDPQTIQLAQEIADALGDD